MRMGREERGERRENLILVLSTLVLSTVYIWTLKSLSNTILNFFNSCNLVAVHNKQKSKLDKLLILLWHDNFSLNFHLIVDKTTTRAAEQSLKKKVFHFFASMRNAFTFLHFAILLRWLDKTRKASQSNCYH